MADLSLEWKQDLQLDNTSDLSLVDDRDMTRQRIIRRLFTAVRGYVWHQNYGGGLIQRIGKTARPADIASLCRAQLKLEDTVAVVPVPVVTVTESLTSLGLFVIAITYTDVASGKAVGLKFEVPTT